MSIAKVQQNINETIAAGATQAITCSALTIGNSAWLFLDWFGGAGNVLVSSIAGGGTWASLGAPFNGALADGHSTQVWVCKNITVADTTVTVTYASSVSGCRRRILELSGTDTTTQPDNSFTNNEQQLAPATTDGITAAATTTVTNNAWVIGWTSLEAAGTVSQVSAGTGFTALGTDPAPSVFGDYEFKLLTTAGSATPTFTSVGSGDWLTWAFGVRPAAAAATAQPKSPTRLDGLWPQESWSAQGDVAVASQLANPVPPNPFRNTPGWSGIRSAWADVLWSTQRAPFSSGAIPPRPVPVRAITDAVWLGIRSSWSEPMWPAQTKAPTGGIVATPVVPPPPPTGVYVYPLGFDLMRMGGGLT